jgi:hypothetical protein
MRLWRSIFAIMALISGLQHQIIFTIYSLDFTLSIWVILYCLHRNTKIKKIMNSIFPNIRPIDKGFIKDPVMGGRDLKRNFTNSERTILNCDQTILSCDQTILNCNQTILSCDQTILNCGQTILSCGQTILSCDQTILSCSQTILNRKITMLNSVCVLQNFQISIQRSDNQSNKSKINSLLILN